jgi:hypothetical protein
VSEPISPSFGIALAALFKKIAPPGSHLGIEAEEGVEAVFFERLLV